MSGGNLSDCFAKKWDPVFSAGQDCRDDQSWVEKKRGINGDGHELWIFLQDYEGLVPSCKAREVAVFCKDAHLDDLKTPAGTAGQRRGAWLDDMSSPPPPPTARKAPGKSKRSGKRSGQKSVSPDSPQVPQKSQCARPYENPLTATGLYRNLKVPRFGHPEAPNVGRRLVYIQNLDPWYLLALAETAPFHQVSALRDAFWKHLALQISIGVVIPARGYRTFRLEFHLPYFALRGSPTTEDIGPRGVDHGPPRELTDLSFLKIQAGNSQEEQLFSIHEKAISLVVCGSDNSRWTAYAFDDTDEDDEDLSNDILSQGEFRLDPMASDLRVDANDPIWDPREYFLVILEIRVDQVLKEWQFLVRAVECSIKLYRKRHSSTLSQRSGNAGGRVKDVKKTFDWTQQAIEVLSQLLDVLSETVKAWETFKSSDGDIGYFSCISQRGLLSLRAIKETFERLEYLQRKLTYLDKSCRNSAQTLQLRLTLEGNEAAQHNGLTQELMASIISPCMLAIAYFTIPQPTMPFKLSSQSFVMSIIVLIVLVRLLLFILGALPTWTWVWKKLKVWIKLANLNGMAHHFSASKSYHWITQKRGSYQAETTTDGEQMGAIV